MGRRDRGEDDRATTGAGGGSTPRGRDNPAAGQGGHCTICSALIDKNEDRATIEKSTRVILGLLSHYSETLLGVIKRGPQHDEGDRRMKNFGSDEEEEEEQTCTPMFICMIVTIVVLVGLAIGGFAWAMVLQRKG
ncbi:unnamed protein product [Amoebophrya sp. A120]|nr:unnamed protein product [Amoebophrya sp. A120]|eukprot:GSA120T00012708001.1